MFRFLPLVLKNCWRNRRRTFLTIASISVSMCLLGVMIAMYHALYLSDATPEQALRLVTRNKISLTATDAGILQEPDQTDSRRARSDGVAMVRRHLQGSRRTSSRALPPSPTRSSRSTSELKIPDDQRIAFERDRTGCVIGRDLANKYNLKIGDRMPLVGDIYPGQLRIHHPRNLRQPARQRDHVFQPRVPGAVAAGAPPRQRRRIHHADRRPRVGRPHRRRPSTTSTAMPPRRPRPRASRHYLLGFVSLLGNVKMFLIAICAAVMFTILLVSANTMAMSVRERVREVGVLKTLGFTDGNVLGMILGEAFRISLLGGAHRLPALHGAGGRSGAQSGRRLSAADRALRALGGGGLHR